MPALTEIKCINCGTKLHEKNIDLDHLTATCSECFQNINLRALFFEHLPEENIKELSDDTKLYLMEMYDTENMPSQSISDEHTDDEEIAKPKNISVKYHTQDAKTGSPYRHVERKEKKSIRIIRPWFTLGNLFALILVVPMDAALLWAGIWPISQPRTFVEVGPLIWCTIVYGVAFLILFLATRSILAHLFNRTIIECDKETLTIRHGPIPFHSPKEVYLDCREMRILSVNEDGPRNDDGSQNYKLQAGLRDGRLINLLEALPNSAEPLFIKQEIEAFL